MTISPPAARLSPSTGISLSDVLTRHALVRPDHVAFVDFRRRCTFAELDERPKPSGAGGFTPATWFGKTKTATFMWSTGRRT